jgi:hypothetical protein
MDNKQPDKLLKDYFNRIAAPEEGATVEGVRFKMRHRPSFIKKAVSAAGNALMLTLAVGTLVLVGWFVTRQNEQVFYTPAGWGEAEECPEADGLSGTHWEWGDGQNTNAGLLCVCYVFSYEGETGQFTSFTMSIDPCGTIRMAGTAKVVFSHNLAADLFFDIAMPDDGNATLRLDNWMYCCDVTGIKKEETGVVYSPFEGRVRFDATAAVITAGGQYETRTVQVQFDREPEPTPPPQPVFITREQLREYTASGITQYFMETRQPHIQPVPGHLYFTDITVNNISHPPAPCDNTYYYVLYNQRVCSSCGYIFTEEENIKIGWSR